MLSALPVSSFPDTIAPSGWKSQDLVIQHPVTLNSSKKHRGRFALPPFVKDVPHTDITTTAPEHLERSSSACHSPAPFRSADFTGTRDHNTDHNTQVLQRLCQPVQDTPMPHTAPRSTKESITNLLLSQRSPTLGYSTAVDSVLMVTYCGSGSWTETYSLPPLPPLPPSASLPQTGLRDYYEQRSRPVSPCDDGRQTDDVLLFAASAADDEPEPNHYFLLPPLGQPFDQSSAITAVASSTNQDVTEDDATSTGKPPRIPDIQGRSKPPTSRHLRRPRKIAPLAFHYAIVNKPSIICSPMLFPTNLPSRTKAEAKSVSPSPASPSSEKPPKCSLRRMASKIKCGRWYRNVSSPEVTSPTQIDGRDPSSATMEELSTRRSRPSEESSDQSSVTANARSTRSSEDMPVGRSATTMPGGQGLMVAEPRCVVKGRLSSLDTARMIAHRVKGDIWEEQALVDVLPTLRALKAPAKFKV